MTDRSVELPPASEWIGCGTCPKSARFLGVTSAVIVEDRGSFGPALARQLERHGVGARWIPHAVALAQQAETLAGADLVLIDALDLDRQQSDPTQSRLASLDLLFQLASSSPPQRPRVVVYSTVMHRPELNIPLRQAGVEASFFDVKALTANVGGIALAERLDDVQVPKPTVDDWHALHPDLPVGSAVAAAHQRIREHERAWRQIWDPDAAFDKAAQVWVSRNVLPLLDLSSASGYRVAIEVIRKVAGLPYKLL